ncbi:metalloregulator ArsR/SmtB family transcription factor [Echinimonas agarilytica]|uniref:Metalloregulator ArsR/SmtB family transcription factor n=2 Tax=Echinimonas agarilytica TaxID=1215918 RepID=A0AA41W5U3_9GAMM|nr:metalloregulator ArsR/SmtB family transcription factor [Echinimonas agarilytica]
MFFKALADDTRLSCLLLIQLESELCVCELMTALEQSQPKISRHLAQLRKLGLLLDRRQGQWVFYRVNPELPSWAADILQTVARDEGQMVESHRARLVRVESDSQKMRNMCQ